MFNIEKIEKQGHTPLYLQLYNQMKEQIEKGQLKAGEKLPSIRNLSYDLQISKTTVQSAYDQLTVEGYLLSREKSGYYVLAQTPLPKKEKKTPQPLKNKKKCKAVYLFSSNTIDQTTVDTKRWRTLVKEALSQESSLVSYGDPQGELKLREELAEYIRVSRLVQTTSEQIVVGAGITPLLSILCGLLRDEGISEVGIDKEGFPVAEQVFYDCGMKIAFLGADKEGTDIKEVRGKQLQALLLSPSKAGKDNMAMPINRRLEFLSYASKENCYIVEDDYNGELRFLVRPIPALKSIDNDDKVIYLGSFSKLLLPSVRIGYMILPENLTKRYKERALHYNQTASKVEQLALSQYLQDGSMQKHLRKLRKAYSQKADLLLQQLKEHFPKDTVSLQETALRIVLDVKTEHSVESFQKQAKKLGIEIRNGVYQEREGKLKVILSFSSIAFDQIESAVGLLEKILKCDESVIFSS